MIKNRLSKGSRGAKLCDECGFITNDARAATSLWLSPIFEINSQVVGIAVVKTALEFQK
jgi:hypothetical protein